MKEAFTLQQKVKVLNKLFDAKCKTEKELQALDKRSQELTPSLIPTERGQMHTLILKKI